MMNRLRPTIIVLVILVVIGIGLKLILSYSYVAITMTDGETLTLQYADTSTQAAVFTGGSTHRFIATGRFLAITRKGSSIVGLQTLSIHPGTQTIALDDMTTKHGVAKIIGTGTASLATGVTGGTYYLDETSRDVRYTNTNGQTTSLSALLNLAANPVNSDNPVYDTAFNISAITNTEVAISTTLNVFLVNGPNIIQTLPTTGDNNFTASAYNAANNHLYLLTSDSKTIYDYNLAQPTIAPTVFATAAKKVNRIVAGGDRVIVYFDNVPATASNVVAAYSKDHQLNPVVYSVTKHKVVDTLKDDAVTSGLWLSKDGTYVATKAKYSAIVTIHNMNKGAKVTVPAPSSDAAAWDGTHFLFAYGDTVWSYDAAASSSIVIPSFKVGSEVDGINIMNSIPTIVTTDGAIATSSSLFQTIPTRGAPIIPSSADNYIYFAPNNL